MPDASPRVLIVEDDPDIRLIASLSLRASGWEVLFACNAGEGVEIAATQLPDAILLDLGLPGMDGLGALRLLRERPETGAIPVVLFTVRLQAQAMREYDRLGISGVIGKPFDPISLAAELEALVRRGAPGGMDPG